MENVLANVSHNHWNFSQLSVDNLKYSNFWTASFTIAYSLIFILGFVGNVIVISVISSKPQMRTVTNIFICNLAVADLLVVLFCVPVTLAANIFIPWIFGTIICKVLSYAQGVSVFASVYSLVAISADRWSSLYSSIGKPTGFTKFKAKIIILLIWVVSLLITIPWLIVFDVYFHPYNKPSTSYIYPVCQENWSSYQYLEKVYFVVVNLLLSFLLPCLVIGVLNLVIFQKVKRYATPQYPDQPVRYNINGITRELILVSVAFVVCWLPLYGLFAKLKLLTHVTSQDSSFNEEEDYNVTDILIPIAQLLGASNSCVNPFLYAFHSTRFRAIVKLKYYKMFGRRRQHHIV